MSKMPLVGILRVFGMLLGLAAFSSCRSAWSSVDHLQVAQKNLERGDLSLADGNFSDALSDFETALEHALRLDDQIEVKETIRSKIRQTKAMSLLRHFESRDLKDPTAGDLLPVTMEPKDYRIIEDFGEVAFHQKWVPRKASDGLPYLGAGRKVTVFPKAGIDLQVSQKEKQAMRAIGPAGFLARENGSWELYSGIFLFSDHDSASGNLIIDFPLGSIRAKSEGDHAFILEVTTNGGCKIIGLVGKIQLQLQNGQKRVMEPGELVFAMKEQWSRKMNVELSTLIATSNLFSEFENPPALSRKMRQQALIQALRTKRHYRALVGDAKTLDDFEVKILAEEEAQKQLSD